MIATFGNRIQTHQILRITLCLIAIASVVGCGKSKSTENSAGENTSSLSSVVSQSSLADCSQDNFANPELKVQVMKYIDSYGQPRTDLVRIKFPKIPSGWKLADWDLVVKRWAVSPDNQSSIDDTALFYQMEKRTASGFSVIHPTNYAYQMFNYTEVKQMASYAGISESTFFNEVSLVVNLRGDSNSFQVLRIQFSNGVSGAVETYVDVLIPSFQANPAEYNADSRHPATLRVLHPLKDKLGQSWSQQQYVDFTKAYCF